MQVGNGSQEKSNKECTGTHGLLGVLLISETVLSSWQWGVRNYLCFLYQLTSCFCFPLTQPLILFLAIMTFIMAANFCGTPSIWFDVIEGGGIWRVHTILIKYSNKHLVSVLKQLELTIG